MMLLLVGCAVFLVFFFYRYGVILKYKTIALGTLHTRELTLLEYKPLFSVKLFFFQPGDAQEVFHTHSFSAYSVLLYGDYMERFFDPVTMTCSEQPRNRSRLIFIAKDRFHQITRSSGCLTLMITGPWGDTYQEYHPATKSFTVSTHGRKVIGSYQGWRNAALSPAR